MARGYGTANGIVSHTVNLGHSHFMPLGETTGQYWRKLGAQVGATTEEEGWRGGWVLKYMCGAHTASPNIECACEDGAVPHTSPPNMECVKDSLRLCHGH